MNNQYDTFTKEKLIFGIDLGTTNSGISLWSDERQQVEIINDKDNHALTPSVVGWNRAQQKWVVGREAIQLSQQQSSDVVYSIKRYIGRAFNDQNISKDRPRLAYKLVPIVNQDELSKVAIDFGDNNGTPLQVPAPEISAKVLYKLREEAALKLSLPIEEIKSAVITVPAYFNIPQREATKEAGKKAGLEDVKILNEPTAAALSFRNTVLEKYQKCRILVYDLGGGTFDISLLDFVRDEDGYAFYTLAVDGDTRLGGDDIDLSVADYLAQELEKRYSLSVRTDDRITRDLLRQKAQEAKKQLSCDEAVVIDLPSLYLENSSPVDAQIELTRAQLEQCAQKVIQRTLEITERVIKTKNFTWKDIDEVILVGWQTLMPAIKHRVEELTGIKPHISKQPELAVALGAGEYAHILSLGEDKLQENFLADVIALPLGIRLTGDKFDVLVEADAPLPYTSKKWSVTTTEDNQQSISVEVLQGQKEATKASECVVLGSLNMNVLPAPKGKPKFDVVLAVQDDGTMQVTVTDALTGKTEKKDLISEQTIKEKVSINSNDFL
jgi:molecular chaperone DnaK